MYVRPQVAFQITLNVTVLPVTICVKCCPTYSSRRKARMRRPFYVFVLYSTVLWTTAKFEDCRKQTFSHRLYS